MLDFNNLTNEQYLELDKIRLLILSDYNKLLKKIYNKNKENKQIFFSNIISRNNEENQIFYDLCLIELAKTLSQKKKISKIITKNKTQAEILKKIIKNIKITYNKNYNYLFFKNIFSFFKNTLYLIRIFINRSTMRKEIIKNSNNIVLIENFFISSMFKEKNYNDRYYGNLSNIQNKKMSQDNLFFFPIFFLDAIKNTNIKKAEKKINLIILGDFLKIKDYFYSLFYFWQFKKIKLDNIFFRGHNIQKLLYLELHKKILNISSLISILNFLFFKRLKEEKVNLKLVIDWYENQIVDKGLNYGKNIFYPNTKSKGYIGLNQIFEVNDYFLPSKIEIENKISPNEICLISKKYFNNLKKKRKDIKFKLAPSFRNEKIFFEKKFNTRQNKIKILVNFTASQEDNLNMIKLINNCKILFSNDFEILIRPHQSSKKILFKKYLSKNLNYKFSNKNIYNEFKNINILISRSSTACFEAINFNVPVLITRRVFNFLPYKKYKTFPNKLWFFCNNEKNIEQSIKKIVNYKKNYFSKDYNSKSAKEYFTKPNMQNIYKFIN